MLHAYTYQFTSISDQFSQFLHRQTHTETDRERETDRQTDRHGRPSKNNAAASHSVAKYKLVTSECFRQRRAVGSLSAQNNEKQDDRGMCDLSRGPWMY